MNSSKTCIKCGETVYFNSHLRSYVCTNRDCCYIEEVPEIQLLTERVEQLEKEVRVLRGVVMPYFRVGG